MNKFKKGDRVVWLMTKQRGVITGIFSNVCAIDFDVSDPEDYAQGNLHFRRIELEQVYDSPLYKALE